MSEWQPIETAPEDDGYGPPLLLMWEPHDMGGFIFVGARTMDGEWINNLDFAIQKPTHWMPLPEGPTP